MIALLRAIPILGWVALAFFLVIVGQHGILKTERLKTARAETATTKALGQLETFRREAAEAVAASQAEARQLEQRHAADLSRIAYQYQEDRKNEGQAAYDRAIADVRSGRLRNVWTCPAAANVSGPASGPSGANGPADDRGEAIGRVLRIAAECDTQVKGLQEIVRSDRNVQRP